MLTRAWNRSLEFVFAPVDAIRLDAFRRVFALTFLLYMVFRLGDWREWLTVFGYHHSASTASCYKPEPLPPLPAWLVPFFGIATLGSSLALVLGIRVRVMTFVVAACSFYAQLVDEMSAFSLNKYYVAIFLLLCFVPDPKPVDPAIPRSRVVQGAWPIRIVQIGMCIQYCTAGLCKIFHGDWLHHDDVLFAQLQGPYRTGIASTMLATLPKPAFSILELSTLAFEILAPLTFSSKRFRPYTMLVGVTFHAFIALTMYNLFYFSAQMVTYYVLFLDPKVLRRIRHRAGMLAWRAVRVVRPARVT